MQYIKSIYFYLFMQFLSFATEKKLMNELKQFLLPLQFLLSLLLLISCLHEIAFNESVILSELCKALAAVSILSLIAATSGNSIQKKNNPYDSN